MKILKIKTPATEKLPSIVWYRGDWIAGRSNPKHDIYRTVGLDKNQKVYGNWEVKEDIIVITAFDEDKTLEIFECSHAGIVAILND